MEEAKKYNHFLVAGKIVFTTPEIEGEMTDITLNAIITGEGTNIPVRAIGKAQQALQLLFHNRTQDPNVKVLDVVVVNIIHLGRMTKEEFQEPPEGMVLQPMGEFDDLVDYVPEDNPIKDTTPDPENPYH